MSANIKVYTDSACITELGKQAGLTDYDLLMGPAYGLDGDAGDRADVMLYFKNVGDQPAVNTRLNISSDPEGLVTFFIGSDELTGPEISLGDILMGNNVAVMFRVSIPTGHAPGSMFPEFEVRYKTMP